MACNEETHCITYRQSCVSYNNAKYTNKSKAGPMKLFSAHAPFEMIAIDLVGPLPETKMDLDTSYL